MLKDVLGVIDASEDNIHLKELTRTRSVVALPVASRYRIVDILLSNMVNSGINNIGIITQNHYNSLMDHLGSGKEWDLNRKRGGLFIFPPNRSNESQGWYKGSVDAVQSIMEFIRKSQQRYVVVSGSNMVCKLTYDDAFQYHLDKKADITILYKQKKSITPREVRKNVLLDIDEEGRIKDMQINPAVSKFNNIYMNMYIIDKQLLDYLLDECISHGNSDFVKDILLKKLNNLKIYGYEYDGYLACINSIKAYYRHNMDILDHNIMEELFSKSGLVYTRVMDEAPAIYSEGASVKNCIVADGCIIEGEVENSVLFRRVKVSKGAKIKNSIIMQGSEVYENAVIENVILDKDVIIRKNKKLISQESYPMVVQKGVVI